MAAERLHADDRADHGAVDVLVAGRAERGGALDRFVDAAVHAEGQAEARGIGLAHDVLHLLARIAQDVQHRAEHLARQIARWTISR